MSAIGSIAAGLELGQDGIWYGVERERISYPSDGHDAWSALEERSFWLKHRNDCILAAVTRYPPEPRGTIFDIGGGNGFVSLALTGAGFDVALVEPGRTGARNAKHRGLKTVICATTGSARFSSHSLPAACLFDVLEHVENDVSFLRSLRDLMKRQGRLYVTVPAHSWLWSDQDVLGGHYRRYTRKSICTVIEHAGFELEFSSYIFRVLPFPIAIVRALPYRLGLSRSTLARHHAVPGRIATRTAACVLRPEVENLRNGTVMRFGASCLVVAKNP